MIATQPTGSLEYRRIVLHDAELSITLEGDLQRGPVVCAAHPTDVLGAPSSELLRRAVDAGVVCVNPRGIGESSPLDVAELHTFEAMVEDLEAVRRSLGLGPWVFWGMSGGGWIGQVYARRHPEALAGLVVDSACPCFRERIADPECILSPFHPAWHAKLVAAGLLDTGAGPDVRAEAGDIEWVELEGVGSIFRRLDGPALLVSPTPLSPEMRRAMAMFWGFESKSWLAEIRVPTLVVCGTADPLVPVRHARAVHEGIAGSRFVPIVGAGHVPVVEGRAEVGVAVRELLAGSSG